MIIFLMFLVAVFLAQNPVNAVEVEVQHHQDGIVTSSSYNITVEAEDFAHNSISTDVYIDSTSNPVGQTPGNFTVSDGTHRVFVNDFWESGGIRVCFSHWKEDGDKSNPKTVTAAVTITAVFAKRYWPGDVTGDGRVDFKDRDIMDYVYAMVITYPIWVTLCDADGNGYITLSDAAKVEQNMGNFYEGDKVGGLVTPVDKFALLAPYIGLTSTILVAVAATAIHVKRVKRRKKKQ